jgi:hypothetical protein
MLASALGCSSCNSGGGGGDGGSCSFSIITDAISPKMATVGIVEWSTTMSNLASASIVYTLDGAAPSVLNNGGTAPVDLTKSSHRTLLLGLKPSSDYTFHIEATAANGAACKSPDYGLPTTGVLPPDAPVISRTVSDAAAQAKGFIVTSSGVTYGNYAIIIDADGVVVWYAESPIQCTRARMDYEGVNMWMVAANEDNSTGEMRFVSMDGQTTMTNISGLADAHHDFAVLPGKIAAMVWTTTDIDAESDLVEMSSDGSGAAAAVFKIGANLYVGGSSAAEATNAYHCNSILYHAADDSFTIGDRDPNLYVKASHAGAVEWQLGGSCTNAPAGASHCVPESWQVNHGHHLLDDGTMLVFNNNTNGSPSDALEFKLSTAGTMSATSVEAFTSGSLTSNVLGDVQRLPNGNTLITYSTDGVILEVDPSWAMVQTLTGSYGYADWRETLYGPPAR